MIGKVFEGSEITNPASPRSSLTSRRTCVILSLMKTLNTDLSDQECLNRLVCSKNTNKAFSEGSFSKRNERDYCCKT